MRYYGFATRDYLILSQLNFRSELSVMEIGVGAGSTAAHIIRRVKEFCGIDISAENIARLAATYKRNSSVAFLTADVCKNISIGKKFDIIFSADTLEHVQSPDGLFTFIAVHLSQNGTALVIFPNESENKHHGVTWFDNKEDLLKLVETAGLEMLCITEVRKTLSHRFLETILWKLPKSIMTRKQSNILPQSFEETKAFAINQAGGIKSILLALYASSVTKLTALFPLYNVVDAGADISNKILLMKLQLQEKTLK